MSGYYPDYEHVWKGIVQSLFLLIGIFLCAFGSKAMIDGIRTGEVPLLLIPVLVLMMAAGVIQVYSLCKMWILYFKSKHK